MKMPRRPVRRNHFFGALALACVAMLGFPETAGAARRLQIEGPRHVHEGMSANFKCLLYADDGSMEDVTAAASWTADSWYARFDSPGKLTAGTVTADQWCKITAAFDGLSDSFEVTIDNAVKALVRLEIRGPSSMPENSAVQFACWATFDDGAAEDVTARADWSSNSSYAAYGNAGQVLAAPVKENVWIRISAGYEGQTAWHDMVIQNSEIKIVRVRLSGPREVDESTSADYVCTAFYDDGTTENVTSAAAWYADSWYAAISSGRLETKAVPEDQWFKLTATFRGLSDTRDVKIRRQNR